MTTWYISTTGSDTTGDGSLGNPYATINKGLEVSINGDTIILLNGQYTITETINVTKEVTITNNGGNRFNTRIASYTNSIFNIQSNNVTISSMTFYNDNTNAAIIIDMMSNGTIDPIFWNNIVINNCNIYYLGTGLELSGTFTISNNLIDRYEETPDVVNIIKIYGIRGNCNITNNQFYDYSPVSNVIYLTSNNQLSGDYFDKCNSKGGILTISNNTDDRGNFNTSTNFINVDYFNQHSYVGNPDMTYNPNTRISLIVHDNILASSYFANILNIDTLNNSDYNTFDLSRVYNNSNTFTDYGALHLDKIINNHSIVTIDQIDLDRPVFRIYDNTLNTGILFHWDASKGSTILDTGGNPITIGGEMYRWVDSISNIDIMNAGIYPATLESELRNNKTYNYIQTVMNTNGYIAPVSGIIKSGQTIFISFKERECTHNVNYGSKFITDDAGGFMECSHNPNSSGNVGILQGQSTLDAQPDYYTTRVWAIKLNAGFNYVCIFPMNDSSIPYTRYLANGSNVGSLSLLNFGNTTSNMPSSICLYEVMIFNKLMDYQDMYGYYTYLQYKWGVMSPATLVFNWDASIGSSILDAGGNPVLVDGDVTRWVDNVSGINMINGGGTPAILRQETRNGINYKYIQTQNVDGGYLTQESGIFKKGYTMYLVFRETESVFEIDYASTIMSSEYDNLAIVHDYPQLNINASYSLYSGDCQKTSLNIRVWCIQIDDDGNINCIVPFNGAVQFGTIVNNMGPVTGFDILTKLYFGKTSYNNASICIYEISIFNGVQTDNEMLLNYKLLQEKWKIDPCVEPSIAFNWDASYRDSMLNKSGTQISIGETLYKWENKIVKYLWPDIYPKTLGNNMVNGGYDEAILESETRNSIVYNYVRTISGTNGYLAPIYKMIKTGCTFYLVFKEAPGSYSLATGSKFMTNYNNVITGSHNLDNNGYINSEDISDTSVTDYTPRVWAIRFNIGAPCTYIAPLNGDTSIPNMLTGINIINISTPTTLYFGQVNNDLPTSICIYEVLVYDGLLSDSEMLQEYGRLQTKWGLRDPQIIYDWDASVSTSFLNINGNPTNPGELVNKWVDVVSNAEFTSLYIQYGDSGYREIETRRGIQYSYLNVPEYSRFSSELFYAPIRPTYTMYVVFRQPSNIGPFFNDNCPFIRCIDDAPAQWKLIQFTFIHSGSSVPGYIDSNPDFNTTDLQLGGYNIRIWALRFKDYNSSGIFPMNGSTSFGKIIYHTDSLLEASLNTAILRFGAVDDSFPHGGLMMYEIVIFDGLLNDQQMINYYYYLHQKWKVDQPVTPVLTFQWDASVGTSILDISGNPVVVGNPITKWVDIVYGNDMINAGSNPAVLESESRNSTTYNYIRTISGTDGYLKSVFGIIKTGCTMYIVFREANGGYNVTNGSKFISNISSTVTGIHSADTNGYINNENINDTSITDYSPRVWAIRFNVDTPCTYIVPLNGDPTVPNLITGTTTISIDIPNVINFGQSDDNYSTSICIYEIIVYDGLQSDPNMLSMYASLQSKWGIV